jgi:hypothetical protein
MQDPALTSPPTQHREPWNKGKLIGAKPPVRSKHVWSRSKDKRRSGARGSK